MDSAAERTTHPAIVIRKPSHAASFCVTCSGCRHSKKTLDQPCVTPMLTLIAIERAQYLPRAAAELCTPPQGKKTPKPVLETAYAVSPDDGGSWAQ